MKKDNLLDKLAKTYAANGNDPHLPEALPEEIYQPKPLTSEQLQAIDRELEKNARRRKWRGFRIFWKNHRMLKSATIALLLFGSLTTTVAAIGFEQILEIFQNFQSWYISASNNKSASENDYSDYSGFYMPNPAYLPDGFEEADICQSVGVLVVIYEHTDGREIYYRQYECNTGTGENTESSDTHSITVSGQPATMIERDGKTTLMWGTKPLFCLSGDATAAELTILAEHMILNP